MATVAASIALTQSVHEAETFWYDTETWPRWLDQLGHVVEVSGDWPRAGSEVTWESGPAGRGTVRERVIEHEALSGQQSEIEDDSITGRQQVLFTPADDGSVVQLRLEYRLKRRSPFGALVDVLFIRRLMGASLVRTLVQFRAALEASRSVAFE